MSLQRVAVLLLLLGPLCRGQQMTHEEEVIRTTYAKLSYADEVRIILDTLQRMGRDKLWTTNANVADRALNDRLAFELSNFRFGKISAISDRKMGDFDGTLTAIGGEILDVAPSVYNYSVNDSPSRYVSYFKFAWKPSPYKFASPAESWPVAKALQAGQFEGKKYTDYVTYTVTVTLDHKSRTYNALMLFAYDASGKLAVYFVDAITDSTAVLFAYEHSMYPSAFAEADLRTVPFIDKWLHDNARSCKANHNERDQKVDICCDPKSGRCGAAKSSLLPRNSQRQHLGSPSGMSSEEVAVRNTYAKLGYACQIGVLANAVLFNGKRFPDDTGPAASDQAGIERELARQLSLELKDFRIGDVAEITEKPLASFITVPGADSFKLVNDGANYGIGSQFSTTNTTIHWTTIRWKSSQEAAAYSKEVSDETFKKTVGQLLAPARVPYSRYASFSVHATLQGKSISYNALFLFPQGPDKGHPWPIDTVIGSELIPLTIADLYPGALVETTFRELPAVQAWIDSHRMSSCPEKGQRRVCCDPQGGICGLDDETLQKAMNVPVDPATRDALPKRKAQ